MIRSAAYKVEFLIVFACVHNFVCVCLTWFVSVLFWRKIGPHSYLAPAACNRGGKPGELFAQQPPLWPQLTPTSSSRVQLFRYKYTCMYECRYDYKCTDSAKYRCNCTRRHYWLHCLVPVLGLDWCPIEPDFMYYTLHHTYVHDSSVGLRMFLGVI